MTDFLADQARFMRIVGQTVGKPNKNQYRLYSKLREEELQEQLDAERECQDTEVFDAHLDQLVVLLGEMLSIWPAEMIREGWAEVMRSNLSKAVKCETCGGTGAHQHDYFAYMDCDNCGGTGYRVQRREDGKVCKGPDYSAPDLKTIMERYEG